MSVKEKIETIINDAKGIDPITNDFEEHYIPGVTKQRYELAKAQMRQILEKYKGKENVPEDVMPSYKNLSYIVYSYTKDAMLDNMENMDKRRERHNLATKVLDVYMFENENYLTPSQITAFTALMERGLIRGTENLENFVRKSPETFYLFCSFCEEVLYGEKEGRTILPIVVYPSPKCGRWYDFLCGNCR